MTKTKSYSEIFKAVRAAQIDLIEKLQEEYSAGKLLTGQVFKEILIAQFPSAVEVLENLQVATSQLGEFVCDLEDETDDELADDARISDKELQLWSR